MITKLSILKNHMAAGRYREALQLAASWGRRGLGGGAHAEAITKGHAAQIHRSFYLEIGDDPDALVAAGLAAIRARYNIEVSTHDASNDNAAGIPCGDYTTSDGGGQLNAT